MYTCEYENMKENVLILHIGIDTSSTPTVFGFSRVAFHISSGERSNILQYPTEQLGGFTLATIQYLSCPTMISSVR